MWDKEKRDMYYTLLDILINGLNDRTKERLKKVLRELTFGEEN